MSGVSRCQSGVNDTTSESGVRCQSPYRDDTSLTARQRRLRGAPGVSGSMGPMTQHRLWHWLRRRAPQRSRVRRGVEMCTPTAPVLPRLDCGRDIREVTSVKRPCLTCSRAYAPGPGARRGRCPGCEKANQRQRDARRGTPSQRGYNWTYQKHRKLILAGGPPCAWGCGRPATTADHLVPLARGGSNDIENLMPSCLPCNRSRGSRAAPSDWVRRPRRRGAG